MPRIISCRLLGSKLMSSDLIVAVLSVLFCFTTHTTEALLFGFRTKSILPSTTLSTPFQNQRLEAIPSRAEGLPSRILASSLASSDGSSSTFSSDEVLNVKPNGEDHKSSSTTAASIASTTVTTAQRHELKSWQSNLTRVGLIAYIMSMCIALPLTLIPQKVLYWMGFLTKKQKEHYAVATAAFCARWLLRLIPFCRLTFYPYHHPNPVESVWVCNHASLLDIFMLLAADRQLRGTTRRPIKIVYWKQLEKNPICNLLFKQAGFIPVQMAANKAGEDNDYDKSSFKQLLKDSKQAFQDGFDIGILPEGQLNPTPEKGLLPVFSGAFTLARMSRRPIQMLAINGIHDLWHPIHGMHCVGRHVKIRAYPFMFRFSNSADFVDTFKTVIGHFAMHGQDFSEEEQIELFYKIMVSSSAKNSS